MVSVAISIENNCFNTFFFTLTGNQFSNKGSLIFFIYSGGFGGNLLFCGTSRDQCSLVNVVNYLNINLLVTTEYRHPRLLGCTFYILSDPQFDPYSLFLVC